MGGGLVGSRTWHFNYAQCGNIGGGAVGIGVGCVIKVMKQEGRE